MSIIPTKFQKTGTPNVFLSQVMGKLYIMFHSISFEDFCDISQKIGKEAEDFDARKIKMFKSAGMRKGNDIIDCYCLEIEFNNYTYEQYVLLKMILEEENFYV